MARPRKNNADWFSHDTNLRDNLKVKALRAKYGLEGYAIFSMFLEVLADADNFILEEQEENLVELLAGDFQIEAEKLDEIMQYCFKIWLLQRENWKIFNAHLIERMEALLNKRKNMREVYHWRHDAPSPPVKTPPEKPSAPKVALMTEEDFAKFWDAYPVKEEKKKSHEKFMKLQQAMLQTILDSIALNKAKNKRWIDGYIKKPTTWINGECWNDEIPETLLHKPSKNGQGTVSTQWHADVTV